MYKITFNSINKLSTITNKPTKIVFDVNPKIEEYVHKHYPNAWKFVVGSDYLTIYNPVPNDLDIIEVSLDVLINE
jgi:hypothetical protein